MPTSPYSFSITATRLPCSSLKIRLSRVVLPEPRKPVRMVTGTFRGVFIFSPPGAEVRALEFGCRTPTPCRPGPGLRRQRRPWVCVVCTGAVAHRRRSRPTTVSMGAQPSSRHANSVTVTVVSWERLSASRNAFLIRRTRSRFGRRGDVLINMFSFSLRHGETKNGVGWRHGRRFSARQQWPGRSTRRPG